MQTVPGEFVALNQFEQLSKCWSDNRELMTQCCPFVYHPGRNSQNKEQQWTRGVKFQFQFQNDKENMCSQTLGMGKRNTDKEQQEFCNKKQMFTLWSWLPLSLPLPLSICKWALGLWMNSRNYFKLNALIMRASLGLRSTTGQPQAQKKGRLWMRLLSGFSKC